MTPAEAAALLTVAAAFDNRKPDADQAHAWAAVLDRLRLSDCREAVIAHYRNSRKWMMPADVRAGVTQMRDARVIAYGLLPDPPAWIDPDDTAALTKWQRDFTRDIADGVITELPPKPEVKGNAEAFRALREIRARASRNKREERDAGPPDPTPTTPHRLPSEPDPDRSTHKAPTRASKDQQ